MKQRIEHFLVELFCVHCELPVKKRKEALVRQAQYRKIEDGVCMRFAPSNCRLHPTMTIRSIWHIQSEVGHVVELTLGQVNNLETTAQRNISTQHYYAWKTQIGIHSRCHVYSAQQLRSSYETARPICLASIRYHKIFSS